MMIRVYATTGSYLLGRMLGARNAAAVIQAIAARGVPPAEVPEAEVPGARAVFELSKLFHVTLRVDGESVVIGKVRSRALHDAIESGCDVWFSVDDDVTATPETLRWLVEAVTRDERPRICIAPCALRNDPGSCNIEWTSLYVESLLPNGGKVRRALRGGFGMVAMNREAMRWATERVPKFVDHDGKKKAAAFLEYVNETNHRWEGEDVAFFGRLPLEVQVEGLVTGQTTHGQYVLDLAKANI